MPHELQKEIENHLVTFPERRKDVEEMRREWNEYKTKTFWVLVGFIGAILSIGVWVGTIQSNIEHLNEITTKTTQQVEESTRRITALEITNGEIRSTLVGIETTLQELKQGQVQLSTLVRGLNY